MVGSADHEVSSGPGSVEANPHQPCLCCNRIRGYIYTGPAYSERFHYLSGCLCPWCVADGSAAKQFGAEFTDTGTLDDVPKAMLEELAKRTPGFMALLLRRLRRQPEVDQLCSDRVDHTKSSPCHVARRWA